MNKKLVIFLLIIFGLGLYVISRERSETGVGVNVVVRKTPAEMKILEGVLRSREGNVLTVVFQLSTDPGEKWPLERKVTIDANTELIKRVVKDFDVYQAEQKAWKANPKGEYPEAYKDVKIKIDEIVVGASVAVESDKNIKFEKIITPTLVRIL